MPRTIRDIEKIWTSVEGIKKLSDRAVGIGPFGIGLDGLLTWIPVLGTVYSVGAAGVLLVHGARAKASPATMVKMLAYLGLDSVTSAVGEVPFLDFVPNVVDVLFPGHLMAAKALQKDIETTHWVEGTRRQAHEAGLHDSHVAEMKRDPKKRRVVYLGD